MALNPLREAAWKVNTACRYATYDELEWLRGAALYLPPHALIVMLGAGPGVMLLAVKDGNPGIRAVVVDRETCDYAMAYAADAGVEYISNVAFVRGDSATVGYLWTDDPIDFLIVDADHSEAGVAADITAWLPHVKSDSWIFFHDYDATGTYFEGQEQYPGVKAAVDRLMTDHICHLRVGTSIVYRKQVPHV